MQSNHQRKSVKLGFEQLECRVMLSGAAACARLLTSLATQEKTVVSATVSEVHNSTNELISQINKTIANLNKQIGVDKKANDATDLATNQSLVATEQADKATAKGRSTYRQILEEDEATFQMDLKTAKADNNSKSRIEGLVEQDIGRVGGDIQALVYDQANEITDLSTMEVMSYQDILAAETALAEQQPQTLECSPAIPPRSLLITMANKLTLTPTSRFL